MKLLSIHLPSNKPRHFRRLVDNLVATAADPTCFEVVVKIDIGDEAMQQAIAEIQRDVNVNLRVVLSEKFPSYFHAHLALDECLRASDPEYYFCWHINDEILIETPHWDTILARYVDFFPDRLFRLKVTPHKMFYNFFDIEDTCLYADYPIVPRRWLDTTETWTPCHGSEVYQEGISVYLARLGRHRNIPLVDIVVGGDEPGKNMSPESELARAQGMCGAWDRLMSVPVQEMMARSARKLFLLILAHERKLDSFEVREEPWRKAFILVQDERVLVRTFYSLDHVALRLRQFDFIARRTWPWSLWGKPPAYRAAVHVYRALWCASDVLMRAVKAPIGLAMGVPMRDVWAVTVDPHWWSIQDERLTRWARNLARGTRHLKWRLRQALG